MPSLAGLIVGLSLTATPGLPVSYANRGEETGPKAAGRVSMMGLMATPVAYRVFPNRAAASEDARSVTDTYVPVLTFGPFDTITVSLTDKYVPTLTFSAQANLGQVVTDTYTPVVTLGVGSLTKTGDTAIAAADSYVPVLSFAAGVASVNAVTDSYVPVVTLAMTVDASDAVIVTDTYVPTITFQVNLQTAVAQVQKAVIDTYVPTLTFTVRVRAVGEVDRIQIKERPAGLIVIEET